jgi:uncharacterized protein YndB with AHSA1/START domain
MDKTDKTGKYVVITRDLGAPPELVWRCWTEPEHLCAWIGPKESVVEACTIDLRVGGRSYQHMHGPAADGKRWHVYCGMKYEELVPERRLVMEGYFADPDGNEVPASYYGNEDWPEKFEIHVELEPFPGGTRLTVRESAVPGLPQKQNWVEMLEKMTAHLGEMQPR